LLFPVDCQAFNIPDRTSTSLQETASIFTRETALQGDIATTLNSGANNTPSDLKNVVLWPGIVGGLGLLILLSAVLVVAIIVAKLRRNRMMKNAFKMQPLVNNLSNNSGTPLQYEQLIYSQHNERTPSYAQVSRNVNPLPYEEPASSLSKETGVFQPNIALVEATEYSRGSECSNNNDIHENSDTEGEYHSPYYSVARY